MRKTLAVLLLLGLAAMSGNAETKTLKVVSWNIEYGKNFDEVLAALKAINADVYLLQEVDIGTKRVGGRNTAEQLGDELDYDFFWSVEFQELKQEIDGKKAFTGQATLIKKDFWLFPVVEKNYEYQAAKWTRSPFHLRSWTQPRKGGRSWQCSRIQLGKDYPVICNTHLESNVSDKQLTRQIKELFDYIERKFAGTNIPIIIAGDLNIDEGPCSPVIKLAESRGFTDVFQPFYDSENYPSTRPHKRSTNDWILVNDRIKVLSTKIGSCDGSDHCPIIIELELQN
ncbi:MAG: endonuclease/exonuclease/phosphatase family protein [Patescibacteria group bacterium]